MKFKRALRLLEARRDKMASIDADWPKCQASALDIAVRCMRLVESYGLVALDGRLPPDESKIPVHGSL